MPFLGWFVSTGGLSPDPSNIDAIDQVPPPTNLMELKSFLGMATVYSNFISKLVDIVKRLWELEQKDALYIWTPE